jgi:hypothetical protein
MDIVTPATQVKQTKWTSFTVNQHPQSSPNAPEGGLSYSNTGNLSFATHEFLGDANGVPVAAVRLHQDASGRYIEHEQIHTTDFLGEIVTRADGSKATIFDIINEKLSAQVASIIVNPNPQP